MPDATGDDVREELLSTEIGIQAAGGDAIARVLFTVTGCRLGENRQAHST